MQYHSRQLSINADMLFGEPVNISTLFLSRAVVIYFQNFYLWARDNSVIKWDMQSISVVIYFQNFYLWARDNSTFFYIP